MYYRTWWLLTTFWFALFTFVMTVVLGTDWSGDIGGRLFTLQLVSILLAIALFFGAFFLWCIRDDENRPLKPWPKKEEREMVKLHAEMDRRERILESREKLAEREQALIRRRDKYIRTIEERATK